MKDKKETVFDFGFSAINEEDLVYVKDVESAAASNIEKYKEKLDLMHSLISNLLENLKKDPEKNYIYWPNRIEKIEEFEKRLDRLLE